MFTNDIKAVVRKIKPVSISVNVGLVNVIKNAPIPTDNGLPNSLIVFMVPKTRPLFSSIDDFWSIVVNATIIKPLPRDLKNTKI